MDNHSLLLQSVVRRLFFAIITLCLCAVGIFLALQNMGVPLPALLVVFVFGLLGGFISIQRRLAALSEKELALMASSVFYTCLAPLVGGLLAIILYIVFIAGLLKGDLFPAISTGKEPIGQAEIKCLFQVSAEGAPAYAKLIVWSFIAGFSEKFVTGILGRLEGTTDKPDGEQPNPAV